MAEYIVTVKKDANWKELHDELSRDTSADSSVDSNIVPDRPVTVVEEKSYNKRNTHYELSKDEATALEKDNRILSVMDIKDRPNVYKNAEFDGDFNRDSSSSGTNDNWGLMVHTSKTKVTGASYNDIAGTYDFVLDGTGVDVVIIDSGIQPNHPEFQDKNGASRVKQINWFTAAGGSISGSQDSNHYRDYDGHGTHVAGTVAGKTFGWAKNADIYAVKFDGLEGAGDSGTGIDKGKLFDLVRLWHNKKNDINDSAYTGRPTVVNMSFGSGMTWDTTVTPNTVGGIELTGGNYRGTSHSATVKNDLTQYGFVGDPPEYRVPARDSAMDADVQQMVDAGIHVCIGAGNDNFKIEEYNGADWNNYLTATYFFAPYRYYYHRGGSPSLYETGDLVRIGASTGFDSAEAPGFMVGAIDVQQNDSTTYKRTDFSNSGKGVDIYAVGDRVISSVSDVNDTSYDQSYHLNSSYKQVKFNGTSMASPQMAGMVALLLQAHPDWSPAQVKNYFINNAQSTIHENGNSADWTNSDTIWGGNNRVAYFPMHGKKPFSFG